MLERSEELRDLYAFNRWANARLRTVVSALSDEEFTRDLRSSYPSVHDTWLHIMTSEWVWLARWQGTSPAGMPPEWKEYSREEITDQWQTVEAAQLAFLDKLTDAALDRSIRYTNFVAKEFVQPLWHLMRHMVNHSTYHRGQITTMLRQLGREAVSTDLVLYFREHAPTIAT